MSDEWYYSNDGQQSGPVSSDEMKKLIASGEISSMTLVWREGMAEWTPAEGVEELLPASGGKPPGPPPLSGQGAEPRYSTSPSEKGLAWLDGLCRPLGKTPDDNFLSWVMKPKPGSRLALSISATLGALGASFLFLIGAIVIPPLIAAFFFCLWLSGIGLMAVIINLMNYGQKKQQLLGLWESVESDSPSIQFTDDGNLLRLDGVSGEYRYSVFGETLNVMIPPASPVTLRVVSITKHELHLSDGEKVSHYKKGKTLTDEELEKEIAAAKEQMRKVGKVAGQAALVAAGVTAVAGLAVLGGVASASGGGGESGGGGSVPPGMRACPGCGRAVPGAHALNGAERYPSCGNCGTKLHYS